jgi:hypothetical protein
MSCPNCRGARLVCEWHHDKAWPNECDCGPGMPCPVCTPATMRMTTEEAAEAIRRAIDATAREFR